MKVCFYCDPHWSQNSSIIRSRGCKYSKRLENLIASVNYVEELAWNHGCSAIICGGDFFDSSSLNSEEISALKELRWSPISHIFLTGNHETNVSSLDFSVSDVFNLCPNVAVISQPECNMIEGTDVEFAFLPYILERDRKTISEYFGPKNRKRIIFSHNDLKDVQYGPFLSTEGFNIADIHANCDLYLNGHIHHCHYVTDKIINGGNLTGQNFTEDASRFEHCALIIDTDTLHVDFYLNPYAFNFYKLDYTKASDTQAIISELSQLKSNSVITIKLKNNHADAVKNYLENSVNPISEYRILIEPESTFIDTGNELALPTVDHLKQFEDYVLSEIGDTNIIREELTFLLR